jgi:hypothetical protein
MLLGKWLAENVNHDGGGDRKSELQDATAIFDLPDGVDKYESSRWQQEAQVSLLWSQDATIEGLPDGVEVARCDFASSR